MSWETPIYDRTASDVSYARLHPDAEADLKGAWNVSDYQRAKGNLKYLGEQLNAYGYAVTLQGVPELTNSSLGFRSYVQLLTGNMQAVLDTFTAMDSTPDVPEPADPWNYSRVNDLEQIMYDTKMLVDRMAAAFRHSGAAVCGQGGLIL